MKNSLSDFRTLIAADLLRATGRSGLRSAISAAVFEPGFSTVLAHRICVVLYRAQFTRIAKLLWRFNVALSGCHIHLCANIGPGLKLPHPTGVVIGEGCLIGASVTIFQHVTIGRGRRGDQYPTVHDGATLYPGAVVVGGVTIGVGAVVGANAVVRYDVPAGEVAAGNPASVLTRTDPRADDVGAHHG